MIREMEKIIHLVDQIKVEADKNGGLKHVIFVACGGSLSATYPARFFLQSESTTLRIDGYNSAEFLYAPPKILGKNTLVIGVSTKATTETVAALKAANAAGCITIAMSGSEDSLTTKSGRYHITYKHADEWYEDASFVHCNSLGTAMKIAIQLLKVFENYDEYDAMIQGLERIPAIYAAAYEKVKMLAIVFGQKYKNDLVFNTLGSGSAWEAVYSGAFCFFQEMQGLHCVPCHSGEYFHGPFETTADNLAVILFKSVGRTRPIDKRVERFLENFCCHRFVLDARDYGLEELGCVAEYFNGMLFRPLTKQLVTGLSNARNIPMSYRNYMWKYEY